MALWIDNPVTDPPWNLAAEEYWLTRSQDAVATLWRNTRSVIIGRNQDLTSEVDTDFTGLHDICVVRRMTGGGAVFHDLGNINYTFICNDRSGAEMSFARFAGPVIDALSGMGVRAGLSGRNDLLVEGMKVSGCAHTRAAGRSLYHGTLLFSADLSSMAGALRVGEHKYAGRAVKSVSSRVANLNRWLPGMTPVEFMSELRGALLRGSDYEPRLCGEHETAEIDALRGRKYANPAWTDGADADMVFLGRTRDTGGCVQAWGKIKNGRLSKVRLTGDFFGTEPVSSVERALTDTPYDRAGLAAALSGSPAAQAMHGISAERLLDAIFGIDRE